MTGSPCTPNNKHAAHLLLQGSTPEHDAPPGAVAKVTTGQTGGGMITKQWESRLNKRHLLDGKKEVFGLSSNLGVRFCKVKIDHVPNVLKKSNI